MTRSAFYILKPSNESYWTGSGWTLAVEKALSCLDKGSALDAITVIFETGEQEPLVLRQILTTVSDIVTIGRGRA